MVHPASVQQRILDLSSKIAETSDLDEFSRIAAELKSALHQHVQELRRMVDREKRRLASVVASAASQR